MFLKHTAVWSHIRAGVRIDFGTVNSGSEIPPGRRLSFSEQLQTHTERKISLLSAKLKITSFKSVI
jgi:hypothetical protein